METTQMIQKATAMDNWWLTASSRHCTCSCIISHEGFLVKHQITQVSQPPYNPDLEPYDFWLFPKLKSPLKMKSFQTVDETWWRYDGAADDNWENCVRSQGAYFEGNWDTIVLCTTFLVHCIQKLVSKNFPAFLVTCVFFKKCLFRITCWILSGQTLYFKVEMLHHMVILFFLIFRKPHTVFHGGGTIVRSHQQGTFSPHPHQHVLFLFVV